MVGTMASSFLADFGADVVLVEPPAGTPMRAQPAWPFWGRGKRSVVLDLTTPAGREELAELGRAADVVIETWRPGVAERLGFGDDDLRPSNPGLVYASVTGFGRDNPLSGLKAYEPVVMAKVGGLSSFANLSRRKGPSFVSTPYCTLQRRPPRAARDPRRADRAGVERSRPAGRHHARAGRGRPRPLELAAPGAHPPLRPGVRLRAGLGRGPAGTQPGGHDAAA